MQVATVVVGLMAWWSAVCRVGMMTPGIHRRLVRWWHGTASVLALACVAWVVWQGGDPLALGTAVSLLAYMLLTLREWASGPPWWAFEQGVAR